MILATLKRNWYMTRVIPDRHSCNYQVTVEAGTYVLWRKEIAGRTWLFLAGTWVGQLEEDWRMWPKEWGNYAIEISGDACRCRHCSSI